MNIRKLSLFLVLMALLWAILALVAIDIAFAIGEPHILLAILAVFYPAFLPGAVIWMGFTVYLAYRFLPEVDAAVTPEMEEYRKRRSDPLFNRLHRLFDYELSVISRRFNRRVHPDFDFRQLPRELQIPLRTQGIWMGLSAGALLICLAAQKFAELLGVMPAELIL